MIRSFSALVLAFVFGGCAPSADGGPAGLIDPDALPRAFEAVSAASVEEAVRHLSDDAMLGRGTGTQDKERAAEWIAARFRETGAVPLTGDDLFQTVKLVGFRKDQERSNLVLRGPDGVIEHENEVTLTWWPANVEEEVTLQDVPLVFVGHGITAPEVGWDDYGDVDVSGKVLVFLNDDPRETENGEELFGGPTRTYYGRWTYKFEQARDRGAAGAIVIHTTESAGYGWQVIGNKGAEMQFGLDASGAGYDLPLLAWMHQDLANELAATVDADLEAWFEDGRQRDFRPVELPVTVDVRARVELERTTSRNVLAVVEGTDPDLRDEVVVVTAHYDHLGIKPETGPDEDAIYNGAWDNAAGTGAIVRIAEGVAVSEIQPRRSVLFFAVSAHEKGLLGSRWFAADPPVDPARFVANVNFDMPQIFGVTRDIVAIGKSKSELGTILADVASRFELADGTTLRVEDDPTPGAGRFYRSDQLHFARLGVPGLYLAPGTDYLTGPAADPVEYRSEHYHQVSDEVNEVWDFEGLARDARLVLAFVLELANRESMPEWSEGAEFARPTPGV